MNEMYNVSSSPHVRSNDTTQTIMRDVVIALIPTTIFGVYNFGVRALILMLACVASCVLSEYVYEKCMHKPITTSDFSAIVTGLLLALNLPVGLPLWMAVLGSVFAILIVKQLFGGLGQNFMNPALGGRCFLMISFASAMTDFTVNKGSALFNGAMGIDGFSGATPLVAVNTAEGTGELGTTLLNMFIGGTAGTLGETSALCILIGGIYMIARKVISPKIPCIYIAVVLLFCLIFGGHGFGVTYLGAQLFGGGLMLGAFFMATDYVTSPITPNGQIVYAVVLGLLTGIFRVFGPSAEGVSYSIIIANLLVPLIERVTIPTPFGKEAKKS